MEQPPIVMPNSQFPSSNSSQRQRSRQSNADDAPVMRWFSNLLETRPMAFWGGVWMSVFLIGVVAFGSLLSPNAAERRSVSAIALGSDSGVATQPLENRGKVPLWMFGAIAITCTAGSILVSRQLQPNAASPKASSGAARKRRRNAPHRVKKHPVHNSGASRQPKRLQPYSPTDTLLVQNSPVPTTASMVATIATPQTTAATNPRLSFVVARPKSPHLPNPSVSAASQAAEVPVTVVPEDQIHPLDWPQARLAEAMDLRKRKSIQSLL